MKHLSLLTVVLVTVATLVHATTLDQPSGQAMRAAAFLDEYAKNEIAADAKFRDKVIALGGAVDRIGVDQEVGVPYVILSSGMWEVKCIFPRSAAGKIATLKPKSLVSITGTVAGKRSETSQVILLQDCRI